MLFQVTDSTRIYDTARQRLVNLKQLN